LDTWYVYTQVKCDQGDKHYINN